MSKQNKYISFDMNQEWFKVNHSITLCNPNNPDDKLVFSSVEELLDFNRKIWDLKKQYEWQPIETAPENECEWFLIYGKHPYYGTDEVTLGEYCENRKIYTDVTGQYIIATHWMPLPQPPTK